MKTKKRTGLHVKVVGMTYHHDYPEWVWDWGGPGLDFPDGDLMLLREPKNMHDPNAVAVTLPDGETIVGHIPAIIAKTIGPEMDKGIKWNVSRCSVVLHPEHTDRPGVELVLMRDSSHID